MAVLDTITKGASPAAAGDLLVGTAAGAATFAQGAATFTVVTAPTLTNSWVNFGGAYATAGYSKDSFGVVRLKGLIKSGTMNTVALTLPAGFRPSASRQFAVNSYNGANNIYGMAEITSAGAVMPVVGANNAFCLDGVQFDTA